MNDDRLPMTELQTFGLPNQAERSPSNPPGMAHQGRAMNPRENLFLNDHLRSYESSASDLSSVGSSIDEDLSMENEALLGDSPLPQPNIGAIYKAIYDYLRFSMALFLFCYSFFLLFNNNGHCLNGSGAIKKLPPVSNIL